MRSHKGGDGNVGIIRSPVHAVALAFATTRGLLGLAAGAPSSLALGRYVASQLFGIEAGNPWIAVATITLLAVVSGAGGMVPAHRAGRVEPILALRFE